MARSNSLSSSNFLSCFHHLAPTEAIVVLLTGAWMLACCWSVTRLIRVIAGQGCLPCLVLLLPSHLTRGQSCLSKSVTRGVSAGSAPVGCSWELPTFARAAGSSTTSLAIMRGHCFECAPEMMKQGSSRSLLHHCLSLHDCSEICQQLGSSSTPCQPPVISHSQVTCQNAAGNEGCLSTVTMTTDHRQLARSVGILQSTLLAVQNTCTDVCTMSNFHTLATHPAIVGLLLCRGTGLPLETDNL